MLNIILRLFTSGSASWCTDTGIFMVSYVWTFLTWEIRLISGLFCALLSPFCLYHFMFWIRVTKYLFYLCVDKCFIILQHACQVDRTTHSKSTKYLCIQIYLEIINISANFYFVMLLAKIDVIPTSCRYIDLFVHLQPYTVIQSLISCLPLSQIGKIKAKSWASNMISKPNKVIAKLYGATKSTGRRNACAFSAWWWLMNN